MKCLTRTRNPELFSDDSETVEPEWSAETPFVDADCTHLETICVLCIPQWAHDYEILLNDQPVLVPLFGTPRESLMARSLAAINVARRAVSVIQAGETELVVSPDEHLHLKSFILDDFHWQGLLLQECLAAGYAVPDSGLPELKLVVAP